MDSLTLYELNQLVGETIQLSMPEEYWVRAEVSELREVRGHCYMELVQRGEDLQSLKAGPVPVARASAKCWKNVWNYARLHFERITGYPLSAGMQVMLRVYAQFHETYGFSWIVTDINPEFTMGDMARRRQEIIRRLKAEGVFDLQKELSLPLFALRIAVISSQSAAGYGDFCGQLADNEFGFQFQTRLFPATMQGEGVELSVIAALNAIHAEEEKFDLVVIIRGGGATSDMSGFDTLALAENVAQFPLPVITGIGHDRDESILDMVSCVRVKTPTAAAAFLIDHLAKVFHRLEEIEDTVAVIVQQRLQEEWLRLRQLSIRIPTLFSLVKTRQRERLTHLSTSLTSALTIRLSTERQRLKIADYRLLSIPSHRLTSERHRLALLSQRISLLDPALLLKRGYSITFCDGKIVRDPKAVRVGSKITTNVEKGTIVSIVLEE